MRREEKDLLISSQDLSNSTFLQELQQFLNYWSIYTRTYTNQLAGESEWIVPLEVIYRSTDYPRDSPELLSEFHSMRLIQPHLRRRAQIQGIPNRDQQQIRGKRNVLIQLLSGLLVVRLSGVDHLNFK